MLILNAQYKNILWNCTNFLQGNVEVWLLALLKEAQKSLHGVITMASIAIKDPRFKLIDFMDNFPAQVWMTYTDYAILSNRIL
mgnify:CR=1 FL=1